MFGDLGQVVQHARTFERDSARSPAMPRCADPGSVATPIAVWKPGSVIARMIGLTSGPRPPGATRIIRSVRSGNW